MPPALPDPVDRGAACTRTPRIQKLLGHATVAMAMRYMKHAPEAYFAEDAAKVAGSLTGQRNGEAEARVALARAALKGA